MKVEIHYCSMWNYKPTAARVAAELKKDLDVDATLVAGSNGIFDIIMDGERVFSKKKIGRFPDPGEATKAIRSRENA